MKRKKFKRFICGAAAVVLLITNFGTLKLENVSAGTPEASGLYITEIFADDIDRNAEYGNGTQDITEFVEVYNATDGDINFNNDYKIYYQNSATNYKKLTVSSDDGSGVIIPARSTAVLWLQRTDLTLTKEMNTAEFRSLYNISSDVPVYTLSGQSGFSNTGNRGVELRASDGTTRTSYYYYSSTDIGDGLSVKLQKPASGTTMIAYETATTPTPGVIADIQKTLYTVNTYTPQITYTPVTTVTPGVNFNVTAEITDGDGNPVSASLYYKVTGDTSFTEISMTSSDSAFTASVPASVLTQGKELTYYIEATDGTLSASTSQYTASIVSSMADAPRVMITELCANPSTDYRSSSAASDYYEYMEIYNNSDQILDLYGYTLFYLYPGTTAPKTYTIQEHTSIEAHSTYIIWFAKTAVTAGYNTLNDFNTHFNVNLSPDDVLIYDNSASTDFNLVNTTYHRGYGISSSSNKADMLSYVWVDVTDKTSGDYIFATTEDSSITYTYQGSGNTELKAFDYRSYSTPGALEEGQVPDTGEDLYAPVLNGSQTSSFTEISKSYTVTVTSSEELQMMELGYCADKASEMTFSDMTLVSGGPGAYTYQLSLNFPAEGKYRYMAIATDLAGNVTRFPYNTRGYTLTVTEDDTGSSPVLTCLDNDITTLDEGDDLVISYSYQDEMNIQSISVFYRVPGQTEFSEIVTTSFRIAGRYFTNIPGDKLVGHDSVEYYVVARNLFRNTTSETKTIEINRLDDFEGIRTNIKEDQNLSGEVLITGKDSENNTGVAMSIDGTDITSTTVMEKGAFFTLNYSGNDSYFKNAISVGTDILTYFAKWSNTLPSKAVMVPSKYFTKNDDGSVSVTMTIWAGTQGSAFETDTAANNDDIKATNFHMVLPDGTKLNPDNGVDPDTVYNIGDSSGMSPTLDVHFTIPADKVDAVGYIWDTTTVEDGEHLITLKSGSTIKTVNVTVDNTAPQITANLTDNATLSALFTLKPEFTDLTGINEDSLEVYLDGKPLKSPYEFQASDLEAGSHLLTIKVEDLCGNAAVKEIPFYSVSAYTDIDRNDSTVLNNGIAKLTVKFPENNTDTQTVNFYRGTAIDKEDITIYSGEGDTPLADSTSGTLGTVTSEEGNYPYQIFEVDVKDAGGEDMVAVSFQGSVNYDQTIRMYVLNTTTNEWEMLTTKTTEDGALNAQFSAGDHVNGQKSMVLIQARGLENSPSTSLERFLKDSDPGYIWDGTSEPEQYDFSFAWITDTQYYTESWPQHFTTMNQWIVNNIDRYNIKYAIHTGDLVDEWEQDYQWTCADENMNLFDNAGLPYGVLAGNHDVSSGNELYDNYWKYFGADRFENKNTYKESYENNLGHYDLVTVDGVEMIMLYMSWDIYTEEIEWMNKILAQYSDRPAILNFHRYTNQKGVLDYTGTMVQEQVVAKNPNVFAVLNGHYHGAAINITAFDDDNDGTKERTVYQICTDYQSGAEGGMGYVKMLYFDLENGKIYMNSYSPVLDDYNVFDSPKLASYTDGVTAYDQDIYELSVNFNQSAKTLTSNSFQASVYKTDLIGTTETNSSEAYVLYSGLVPQQSYAWYAVATNSYGLKTRTPLQEFTYTGEFIESTTDITENSGNTVNSAEVLSANSSLNTGDRQKIAVFIILITASAITIPFMAFRKKLRRR